ncbi:MAG: response regulator [Candidatus Gastranaerophilales bacterium]|nr:response regulator [Candidatus Gastranaerophilales bacterium]
MQRVLIVDDAEVNREILRSILTADYAVDVAEDGEQAIQKLWESPNDIEAILLDLHMPKLDGFAVLKEMDRNQWMNHIPVLIISGEGDAEVESRCFEMGVSDFIHKPFEAPVVKSRIRNAVEWYRNKNRLEQQVEQQTEVLRKKDQIIQLQADRLKREEPFHNLMMQYRCAIMEVETKLKVLNEEFSREYKRNPIESIKSRLKSPESIYEKLERKRCPVTMENIETYLSDVAGVRVICSFPDDIYRLAELLAAQDDITLLKRKDYIKEPKPNGYRSLHLIVSIPIFLSREKKYMKVEVQLRTIAMDFWASLEHKLKYKKNVENTEEIVGQLKACAVSIEALDYQMQEIRNKIDRSNSAVVQE